MLTPVFFLVDDDTIGSVPVGATALTPPGPVPPATRSNEIGRGAELVLHLNRESSVLSSASTPIVAV